MVYNLSETQYKNKCNKCFNRQEIKSKKFSAKIFKTVYSSTVINEVMCAKVLERLISAVFSVGFVLVEKPC